MSELLVGIRSHLADARAEHERILDRIQKLEQLEGLAVELEDMDGAEAPASSSPPKEPAPAPARRSTPAGRRSAARRPSEADRQAHTASGASTGGRRAVSADDIVDDVKRALREIGPASPNAIGLHLGYQKSTSGMTAVRACIAKLLGEGVVRVDGQIRGRPAYALVTGTVADVGTALKTPAPMKHPLDQLVDKIVEQLEIDGGRVGRSDLKDRCGDPSFEDFNLALDRAVVLDKIRRCQAGGVSGYELVRK